MIFFFDTETTGLPRNWKAPISDIDNWPRIIQIAYEIYTEDGRFYKKENFIIKPNGFSIPEESTRIHNISDEFARLKGIELDMVLNQLLKDLNYCDIIVAHNLDFDYSVLACELHRKNLTNGLSEKRQICTMKGSLDFCQIPGNYGLKWPSLSELYFKIFNESFADAHDASVDISITIKCFWSLVEKNIIKLSNYISSIKEVLESIEIGKENVDSRKKTCKNCNHKYEKVEVYCRNCGTKMNPSRIDTFPSPNEEYYRDNDISEIGVFVAKEMASDAMDEECYYEAIEYFQKVIELSNEEYSFDKADANNGIGICYFKLNNFIEAEKYFLKNKQLLPAFPFTYENLVATYYNLEEFNQLFEICENLPSNIEVTPTIWYYVGLANEKIGDLEISRTAFQKALLGGMDNCFEDLNRVLIKISNNNE